MQRRILVALLLVGLVLTARSGMHRTIAIAGTPTPLPSGDCIGYVALVSIPGYAKGQVYLAYPSGNQNDFVRISPVLCSSIPNPGASSSATPTPGPTGSPGPPTCAGYVVASPMPRGALLSTVQAYIGTVFIPIGSGCETAPPLPTPSPT
jgi:hypothetical protein